MDPTDPDRPSAGLAAARTVVLRAIAIHALAGPDPEEVAQWQRSLPVHEMAKQRKAAEARRREIWEPYFAHGFDQIMSPAEIAFAETPDVELDVSHRFQRAWQIEAFQTLLWALGHLDALPPLPEEADPDLLADYPPGSVDDFIEHAALRPADVLDAARAVAEMWHWRSRTRRLQEDDGILPPPGTGDLDDVVRDAARQARAEGLVDDLADGDFAIGGVAFRHLDEETWQRCHAIAVERHRALNWLCGFAADADHDWDSTPRDT